jgi:oligopeptide transport system substrate-binding protein
LSEIEASSSDAAFAKKAGRQLLVFFIGAALAIAALMFALQGLASLVGSSTATAQAIDLTNNSISIAIREEPPQLDNSISTDSSSGMIFGHVMEGLLRMDMNDQLEAGIAERWEVRENGATFWLRENARWSDGESITAHDFVFSWTTVLLPATASEYSFLLYSIKNGRAVNEGTMPPSALGVRALDDRTLFVEFERPVPFFDKLVSFPTYYPIREDFYRSTQGRFGADADELIYSGPFVISSWIHGASLIMDRNPYYWDQERIKLDRINVAHITQDPTAKFNFFNDGMIAFTTLSADNLTNAMEQRWHIQRNQDGSVFFIEFNHRPERITRNRNLRKAMQLVMDMEELVYKVTKLPGYLPGESLFPVWLMGTNEPLRKEYPAPKVKLNQALALQHLAMAKRELGIDSWPQIALLSGDTPVANIQSEWTQAVLKTKLGLDIRIDKQIFKQRLAKMTSGDFDLVLAGWGPDYDDPLTFADLFTSWNLNNRGRYESPAMDQFVDLAQSSIVKEERMQAFGKIQQLLFDDVVILPMYERGVTYVVHPQLKNVKRRVVGAETDFTNAYIVPAS